MRIRMFLALAPILVPAAASACPDWRLEPTAAYLSYRENDLLTPKSHPVVAGGEDNLNNCAGLPASATGYLAHRPDFELEYSGGTFRLEMRTTGECDTILFVHTAGDHWLFDDDDGGEGNASLRITRPLTGVYKIWVGTYQASTCYSNLELQTFPTN